MENYSYSSYPDSRDSSPRSREIDCENQSWEEPPSSNYKVKFMCSYNGKIQPRPHDNQLAYVGGDTKILAVDRSIKFSAIKSKLSSICNDADLCFKYQLPGEDLDALISVTNDEDLEHMMLEYDRLLRGSAKPARLRLFLFPVNSAPASFSTGDPKLERQWFVDALNSVQLEGSSPPAAAAAAAAGNPDFLFGLDKGFPAIPAAKFQDSAPAQTAPDVVPTKDMSAGSDCGSEDRHVVSDPQLMSQAEIQRQIHELQRMQIANQEQAVMYQRKSDEINPRAYVGDYYTQKVPEKIAPAPVPVPVPVQMQIPPMYMPERHMTSAGGVYSMAAAAAPGAAEHQMYLIQTPTGVYQAVRPVTGPVNQNYYGVQRVVQETYREQPVYNAVAQQGKIVGGAYNEGNIPVVQQQQQQQQMYYTTQGGGVGVMAAAASYQTVAPVAVDSRQGGGGVVLNQEGKVVTKAS